MYSNDYLFKTTKEILIAMVQNKQDAILTATTGEDTGKCFEALFNKLKELSDTFAD